MAGLINPLLMISMFGHRLADGPVGIIHMSHVIPLTTSLGISLAIPLSVSPGISFNPSGNPSKESSFNSSKSPKDSPLNPSNNLSQFIYESI